MFLTEFTGSKTVGSAVLGLMRIITNITSPCNNSPEGCSDSVSYSAQNALMSGYEFSM